MISNIGQGATKFLASSQHFKANIFVSSDQTYGYLRKTMLMEYYFLCQSILSHIINKSAHHHKINTLGKHYQSTEY